MICKQDFGFRLGTATLNLRFSAQPELDMGQDACQLAAKFLQRSN
jgi:hypothetical protein